MANKVYVIGVGMTKFEKPGRRKVVDASGVETAWDYPHMAKEAGTKALEDAGIDYRQVRQAYVGYVYGESTSGQRAVYELGMTGIPVVNVNNNCSTGSAALYLAAQAVKGGLADCALALGFEKRQPGSLGTIFDDREQSMGNHLQALAGMDESQWDAVVAVRLKGHAVLRHAAAYWKAHSKAGNQPNAAVVNTASASVVSMPNAGQSNYGAAKAAIAALTLATPGMGANLGAEVEEGEFDAFSPANISPLVAYLATEKCPITGKVCAVQGGAISELAGWHDVRTIETDGPWLIDDIAGRLAS